MRFLIIIAFLLFVPGVAVAQVGASDRTMSVDGQKIADESFDKLFNDFDIFVKDYRYKRYSEDRVVFESSNKLYTRDEAYEYMKVDSRTMRRLLSRKDEYGEIGPSQTFRPFSEDFEINRALFDRFAYRFKTMNDGNYIIEFSPKDNLQEKHYFDRCINQLIGEVEIKKDGYEFIVIKWVAHLPQGVEIKYLSGLGKAYSVNVEFITEKLDGLLVPTVFKLDTRFRAGFSNQHKNVSIILKDYEKIETKEAVAVVPFDSKSKPEEPILPRYMWSKAHWAWLLSSIGILIGLIIFLYRKFRKKKDEIIPFK